MRHECGKVGECNHLAAAAHESDLLADSKQNKTEKWCLKNTQGVQRTNKAYRISKLVSKTGTKQLRILSIFFHPEI